MTTPAAPFTRSLNNLNACPFSSPHRSSYFTILKDSNTKDITCKWAFTEKIKHPIRHYAQSNSLFRSGDERPPGAIALTIFPFEKLITRMAALLAVGSTSSIEEIAPELGKIFTDRVLISQTDFHTKVASTRIRFDKAQLNRLLMNVVSEYGIWSVETSTSDLKLPPDVINRIGLPMPPGYTNENWLGCFHNQTPRRIPTYSDSDGNPWWKPGGETEPCHTSPTCEGLPESVSAPVKFFAIQGFIAFTERVSDNQ